VLVKERKRERGGTEDAEMKERAVRGHGEAARERERQKERIIEMYRQMLLGNNNGG
jgi:hypothetical protein